MPLRFDALRRRALPGPFLASLAGFAALVVAGLLWAGAFSAADTPGGRIPFQISTGLTGGAYFPVGEAIAGLLSHPAGVDRCNQPGVCGPAGLIITARSSPGPLENLVAVNSGAAESGLARSDVVAAAMKGEGQFLKGKASHVRVIASLFSEDVHLIVSARSKIKSVADLKGKRVAIGAAGSGLRLTALEILSAYGMAETSLKPVEASLLNAGAMMSAGKLDAIFVVGGIPVEQASGLLAGGKTRLVPIGCAGRDRLIKRVPFLSRASIPANTYPGQGAAVETVSARALWIVRDTVPDALVYGITRALFNPANREGLAESHPSAREIGLATAAQNLPAPLHPGAMRYYREMKVIP